MIIGLIIVCLGILYLIEAINPSFAVDYSLIWPAILMIIAIYNIIKNHKLDLFMSILFFVGLWFFLINMKVLPENYTDIFWPIIIILVGLSTIFTTTSFKRKTRIVESKNKNTLNYNGIFGGLEEKVKEKNFKGANVYSVFGAVDLDLREIEIKGDSVAINVYSIFGGSTLILPNDYNIVLNSSAIFGGNENKNNNDFKEGQKTLYINCISVFGGTELK